MKLEQASKVKSWTPTRLTNGEGCMGREETNKHLYRTTGVVSTACEEGDLQRVGEARDGTEVASPNVAREGDGQSGSRRGPYDRGGRVTPAEGRALASGVLVKEERCGD